MDTLKLMSKKHKIFNRTFGMLLVLISLVIGSLLVPNLLPLIKKSAFLFLEPGAPFVRQGLYEDWFMQAIGWTFAIIFFHNGRMFLSYDKKPS